MAALRGVADHEVLKALTSCKTLTNAGYVQGASLTEAQAALALQVLDNWLDKAKAEVEASFEAIEAELSPEEIAF